MWMMSLPVPIYRDEAISGRGMRLPRSRLPARRMTPAGEPTLGGQVARNDTSGRQCLRLKEQNGTEEQ